MSGRLWALVFCAALCGCWKKLHQEERSSVAVVGGVPIYADEFKREFTRVRLETDEAGAPPADSDTAQKRALLDDLINQRLLLQEADKNNVIVPSDAVEGAYARLRSGWKEDEFLAQLKQKDMTPVEVKSALRDTLRVRKFLTDHVFARVAVTDQEIDAYVKTHPDVLQAPETVHAREIVVKSDEQAQKVLQDMDSKGVTFEDLAVKYSVGPEGQNGGDLGTFAKGVMPEVFDQVCFALRVGEVSKVVTSPYGFHLFKVLEHRPARELSLADVRGDVETTLRRIKEEEAQAQAVQALRVQTHVVIKEDQLAAVL